MLKLCTGTVFTEPRCGRQEFVSLLVTVSLTAIAIERNNLDSLDTRSEYFSCAKRSLRYTDVDAVSTPEMRRRVTCSGKPFSGWSAAVLAILRPLHIVSAIAASRYFSREPCWLEPLNQVGATIYQFTCCDRVTLGESSSTPLA